MWYLINPTKQKVFYIGQQLFSEPASNTYWHIKTTTECYKFEE
jgi:hypothetical protein